VSTCERCGAEIEKDSKGNDWWCTENCEGITDRIRARLKAFRLSATAHPCNLCGLSCLLEPEYAPGGLVDVAVVGGYSSTPGNGSGALDDGDGYRFSLCEFCLDWLFAQFRIPVTTFDPRRGALPRPGETVEQTMERNGGWMPLCVGPDPDPWKPAEHRVREDAWRSDKGTFFEEKERRDAARRARR